MVVNISVLILNVLPLVPLLDRSDGWGFLEGCSTIPHPVGNPVLSSCHSSIPISLSLMQVLKKGRI